MTCSWGWAATSNMEVTLTYGPADPFSLLPGILTVKYHVCFMGLTVRLQSDPQLLLAALQSGFIMITINVRAFAHWKKCAADLTNQTRTMACLTAVQNWIWWWFPRCFWKHVPQCKTAFTLSSCLKMWQNEWSWRRKWKCKFDDLLLISFVSHIMKRWPWNEKAFLLMHFHFQIWHFKLNFGTYLLGHLLETES